MVDRIRFLTSIFAIDVAAYAVMSNHYHLFVYVDESEAMVWSDEEVYERWQKLYHNHPLVERLQKDKVVAKLRLIRQTRLSINGGYV